MRAIIPEERILEEEPMSRHTTFRVGGPAQYLATAESPEELGALFACCRRENVPFFLLGNGSNLLVGDRGFRGVVIRLGKSFSGVKADGQRLTAGAGALLSQAARTALDHGLSGMEPLSGIPGTVGGAVRMNAGAYGREMAELVETAEVMDAEGRRYVLSGKELAFGYRDSAVRRKALTVLGATFFLEEASPEQIAARMREFAERRREKQPLEYPSAGSTFKRPEGYYAGKLIMDAGLRGFCLGGAQVSEKHCGFIVNKGNATAADIAGLIRETADIVQKRFQVTLEPEVIFLGDF
ncbi:MAG: UDP-N-acetylmuramate dehydrogenase [Eubacteriales bacterium]|nr:UDP-N-acetylmuramate dehydrogenase [Eubacteriales bacterium]